jgi:phospholipid/cholesterol/gamma-HCH transport system permease protein
VVLARVGTATVAELGMARASGELEALEVLGIDPVHYLVVPRMVGFSAAVVCLAVHLVLASMASGYVVAFVRGLDMRPWEFAGMVAGALSWVDFPLLGLKTAGFGVLTSMIICYHGLARPLRMEEVGEATTRTVAHTVVACMLWDALLVPVYLAL